MKPPHEMVLTMISMHQQGMHVTREMVYSLIQSCIKKKDVDSAKFFLTTFMLKYKINLASSIGDIFIRFLPLVDVFLKQIEYLRSFHLLVHILGMP